ncbi:MAG TPA: RpiB/LacA/LacB family sugar-phosphate isomerase [Candidatus Dormibacteraeota bacterium]|nr:RpiB/LacA/LacB family sugar-phosphate isomerase [Candidatus Dormibacteraeota bacterium]
MNIALSTDHAGYTALKQLKQFLEAHGHTTVDFGPKSFDANDDYPDFIFPAAQAVARGECDYGIIFGGSGQGEAMAANRIKGVRCAVFYGPAVAVDAVDADGTKSDDPYEILKLSRSHNHANMLSLAGRFLTEEQVAHAAEVWLGTLYSDEPRHVKRVAKLDVTTSEAG